MDPSREDSLVLIWFAKPLPYAQLSDNEADALDDSIKSLFDFRP
jgi:hypothetical protein